MKITWIEPHIISHPLEEAFFFSQRHYKDRTLCVVKITTDQGLHGWGEGYGPAQVIRAGIEFFASLIMDEDPIQQETLWQRMYLGSLDHARRGKSDPDRRPIEFTGTADDQPAKHERTRHVLDLDPVGSTDGHTDLPSGDHVRILRRSAPGEDVILLREVTVPENRDRASRSTEARRHDAQHGSQRQGRYPYASHAECLLCSLRLAARQVSGPADCPG